VRLPEFQLAVANNQFIGNLTRLMASAFQSVWKFTKSGICNPCPNWRETRAYTGPEVSIAEGS
jgi:hypothetical protein